MYDITRRRIQAAGETTTTYHPHHLQRLSENEVSFEDWRKCDPHNHSDDGNDTSTLSSQQPSVGLLFLHPVYHTYAVSCAVFESLPPGEYINVACVLSIMLMFV